MRPVLKTPLSLSIVPFDEKVARFERDVIIKEGVFKVRENVELFSERKEKVARKRIVERKKERRAL